MKTQRPIDRTENFNPRAGEASHVRMLTREEFLRILARYEGKTGFGEWAGRGYNIANGCAHNCRYCVQRQLGVRHGDLPSRDAWKNEQLKAVRPKLRKFEGGVMFPTAHDITPPLLCAAIAAIKDLLAVDNEVLIVSKPHLDCIKSICQELNEFKDKILFRFTISTLDKQLTAYWEPGAPDPSERLACLKYAKNQGFRTSVSMEPMLAGREETIRSFHRLLPWVTETVWVGKMNRKAVFGDEGVKIASRYLRELQSDDNILELVSELSGEPKVRWKDSVREVIRKHV